MKTKPIIDSAAAFPDENLEPSERDLQAALGPAFRGWKEMTDWLDGAHPDSVREWHFSPRSGWHQIAMLKKRRLFYFTPKHGDFRLALILGDKAIDSVKRAHATGNFARVLQTGKRYPEGTAFSFDAEHFKADVVFPLVRAKIEF